MAKTSSASAKSGGSTPNKTGGSAGGKELSKASSSSGREGSGGILSSIGSFLSGGNRTPSAPTAADRPRARPDVLVSGTGKDRTFIDTKTGQRFSEPEYSAFSFRGLTSNDPANVMRNREAAQRYAALDADRQAYRDGRDSGIASVLAQEPAAPEAPKYTPEQLASIGASTAPIGPVEIATPTYGLPSLQPIPSVGYGAALQPMQNPIYSPFANMNLADIFATFPPYGIQR